MKSRKNAVKRVKTITAISSKLPEQVVTSVKALLTTPSLMTFCQEVIDGNAITDMTAEDLLKIANDFTSIKDQLDALAEHVENAVFLKDGYKINIQSYKTRYRLAGIHKEVPNFNFKRLEELYTNPPATISPYHSPDTPFHVKDNVFRKFLIAVVQSVFNEMDLLCMYVGKEGSGKSTLCTQHMQLVHYILRELNVSDYPYKIEEMFFNSLSSYRNFQNEVYNQRFRIFGLDEGNELNRKNWREPEVQEYVQRLRREREQRRFQFVCLPVIGEMIDDVTLSRVNFIFETTVETDVKTSLLRKGIANWYIIPRASTIYSLYQKKILDDGTIRTTLKDLMKDKNYLKGIPKSLLIDRINFDEIWGFDRRKYIKTLKDTNQFFTVRKKHPLISDTVSYYFFLYNFSATAMGNKMKDPGIVSVNRFFSDTRHFWQNNHNLRLAKDIQFKTKYGYEPQYKDYARLKRVAEEELSLQEPTPLNNPPEPQEDTVNDDKETEI